MSIDPDNLDAAARFTLAISASIFLLASGISFLKLSFSPVESTPHTIVLVGDALSSKMVQESMNG